MLCNVWDVLAPLQRWDYKFYLRCGGADTHTLQDTHRQKYPLKSTTSHQSQHQKEAELRVSCCLPRSPLPRRLGAVMIPPPACEGAEVGAQVALQPAPWKALSPCVGDGDSSRQTAKTAGGESPPPSSALVPLSLIWSRDSRGRCV